MSEESVVIEGNLRTEGGKNYNRKLRATGKVPGNILHNAKSQMVEIEGKLLSKAWKNGKKFDLVLNGETKAVRIQELQINPVKRTAVHVDLMYV